MGVNYFLGSLKVKAEADVPPDSKSRRVDGEGSFSNSPISISVDNSSNEDGPNFQFRGGNSQLKQYQTKMPDTV